MHTTVPFPYLHWDEGMPQKKNWTSEFWAWLKGPGTVVVGFAVCLFAAGKYYGSDTTDMRNALANHTTQLQAATLQSSTLNTSIIELTKATQEVNKRQDVQQSAMIELIKVVIPLVRSVERRQHLQEVLDGMREKKISQAGGDFANGYEFTERR